MKLETTLKGNSEDLHIFMMKSALLCGASICFCQCLWKGLLTLANLPVNSSGQGKTDYGEGVAI